MGVTGREGVIAIGVVGNGSWGVATSVTRRVYFDSDNGLTSTRAYVDDQSMGQTFMGPADVGDFQPVNYTGSGQLYYDHPADQWLAAIAMGSPAVTAVSSQGASNSLVAYSHVLDLAAVTEGRAVTIASYKKFFTEEVPSAKVTGFSFSYGNGGVLTKSFSFLGNKSTNAGVNTASGTTTSALAPLLVRRIYRQVGSVRVNLQSGGSLGSGDVFPVVEGFTFTFQRPMDTAMPTGQNYTREPLDNGWPSATVQLQLTHATTVGVSSFYALYQSGTPLKGDFTFTGDYINSATPRELKIEAPHMEPQGYGFSIGGAAQAKPTLSFVLKKADTAPTGMAFTNPFRITWTTTNSVTAF